MNNEIPATRVVTSPFIPHLSSLAALAMLLCCLAPQPSRAGGIPEPGITLYGQVFDDDGSLVTEGRLIWTYSSLSPAYPVEVRIATDLAPIAGASGTTFSYTAHLPAEMPVPGQNMSTDYLPGTDDPVAYERDATVDGAFATIVAGSPNTTFGYADRGRVERVDLVTGINGPPDAPSAPSPADGNLLVPFDAVLNWADAARAETYDVYLWSAPFSKPPQPIATALTSSDLLPPIALRADTDYTWQVVAHNIKGSTEGPYWTFRTAFAGDLQKLLDYLLGKRPLSFEEQKIFDLNSDNDLNIADFVTGLRRTSYQTPPPGEKLSAAAAGPAPVRKSSLLPGPRAVQVGSRKVYGTKMVSVFLPVDIVPDAQQVAGVNFHIEVDAVIVDFAGIQATSPQVNEDLHFYSPRPGALNVVFFTNPVQAMGSPGPFMLMLELIVTPPSEAGQTQISVTSAALSDVDGAAAPEVSPLSGYIYFQGPGTLTGNWQLYP